METINLILLSIVIIVTIALTAYWHYRDIIEKEKNIKLAKEAYDKALQSSDKADALKKGRLYYSWIRDNNTLTIYDEQAITNDLSAMK